MRDCLHGLPKIFFRSILGQATAFVKSVRLHVEIAVALSLRVQIYTIAFPVGSQIRVMTYALFARIILH